MVLFGCIAGDDDAGHSRRSGHIRLVLGSHGLSAGSGIRERARDPDLKG